MSGTAMRTGEEITLPPGRYLRTMPAAAFLPAMSPELLGAIERNGYVPLKFTRPHLSDKGIVSVRLVFRARGINASLVVAFSLRGVLADELLDALFDAMRPVMTLDG